MIPSSRGSAPYGECATVSHRGRLSYSQGGGSRYTRAIIFWGLTICGVWNAEELKFRLVKNFIGSFIFPWSLFNHIFGLPLQFLNLNLNWRIPCLAKDRFFIFYCLVSLVNHIRFILKGNQIKDIKTYVVILSAHSNQSPPVITP